MTCTFSTMSCNCSMQIQHLHVTRSRSPHNVLHSPSIKRGLQKDTPTYVALFPDSSPAFSYCTVWDKSSLGTRSTPTRDQLIHETMINSYMYVSRMIRLWIMCLSTCYHSGLATKSPDHRNPMPNTAATTNVPIEV